MTVGEVIYGGAAAIAALVVIVGCLIWLVRHVERTHQWRKPRRVEEIAVPDWDY